MSKTTLVVVALVVVVIIFRDRIFGPSMVGTSARPAGYDYFGAPPPAPSYAASPPTHQSTSVTDIINSAITAAGQIFGGAFSTGVGNKTTNPGATTPAPVTTSGSGSGTVLLA